MDKVYQSNAIHHLVQDTVCLLPAVALEELLLQAEQTAMGREMDMYIVCEKITRIKHY